MRVAKKHLIYHLTHSPPDKATTLCLTSLEIQNLANALDECKNLISLNLGRNALTTLTGSGNEKSWAQVAGCMSLFYLDLCRNDLRTTAGIDCFDALGYLNLSNNNLTISELSKIKHVHVLEMHCSNNPRIQYSSSSASLSEQMTYRQNVLTQCPRVWVIDGHFVSSYERIKANTAILTHKIDLNNNMNSSIPPPSTSSLAYEFLNKTNKEAPTKNQIALDAYRLKYLLEHYDYSCHLHNSAIKVQVHTPKQPLMSITHTKSLLQLSPGLRIDLAILLSVSVEYVVPEKIMEEALYVLIGASSLLLDGVVEDLVKLPVYVKTAMVACLKDVGVRELNPDLSSGSNGSNTRPKVSVADMVKIAGSYTDNDRELLASIPDVVTRYSPLTTNSESGYASASTIRCRRAVILISRSPSCPALVVSKQTNAEMQRVYGILSPLLKTAGFSSNDLNLDDGNGKPEIKDPGRPYRLYWSENSNNFSVKDFRKVEEEEAPESQYDTSTPNYHDYKEDEYYEPSPRTPTPSTPSTAHVNYLRKPRIHEQLQVFPNQYTRIQYVQDDDTHANTVSVTVNCFSNCHLPPYNNVLTITRSDISWDPRGFWSHIETLKELSHNHKSALSVTMFRRNNGMSSSGMARSSSSVPNLSIPIQLLDDVKREYNNQHNHHHPNQANPLQLYSADDSWDSAFVLAPPSYVEAQNVFSSSSSSSGGAIGGGWSKVEDIPFNMASDDVLSATMNVDSLQPASTGTLGLGRSIGKHPLETESSILQSSVGSSTLNRKFGHNKTELQFEFNELMKEMGTVRNTSMAQLQIDSSGSTKKRINVDEVIEHIAMRRYQLYGNRVNVNVNVLESESESENDGGNGMRFFDLTAVDGGDGEHQDADADGDADGDNLALYSSLEGSLSASNSKESSSVFKPHFLTNSKSKSNSANVSFNNGPETKPFSSLDTCIQPPQPQKRDSANGKSIRQLEQQLGLKPPKLKRVIGPKLWFTKSGKSELLIGSRSASQLGYRYFGGLGSSRIDSREGLSTNFEGSSTAFASGKAKLLLGDGNDESLSSSLLRARLLSAGSNRWEQRFATRSGPLLPINDKRNKTKNSIIVSIPQVAAAAATAAAADAGDDGGNADDSMLSANARVYDEIHSPSSTLKPLPLPLGLDDVVIGRSPKASTVKNIAVPVPIPVPVFDFAKEENSEERFELERCAGSQNLAKSKPLPQPQQRIKPIGSPRSNLLADDSFVLDSPQYQETRKLKKMKSNRIAAAAAEKLERDSAAAAQETPRLSRMQQRLDSRNISKIYKNSNSNSNSSGAGENKHASDVSGW